MGRLLGVDALIAPDPSFRWDDVWAWGVAMTPHPNSSDLRQPAVNEQLGPVDERGVIGCQKDGGFGDVLGLTDAPERHLRSKMGQQSLLLRGIGSGQVERTAITTCSSRRVRPSKSPPHSSLR